jgi:hypothetical protein
MRRLFIFCCLVAGSLYATLPIQVAGSVERLANGNTLMVDAGQIGNTAGRAFEVDTLGRLVWAYLKSDINWTHTARRLENGNTLIAASIANKVLEVNPACDSVWAYSAGLDYPNEAQRLVSGNTLITDRNNSRVIEVDPAGTVVWSYTSLLHPHNANRLPNGNTLICDSDHNRVIEVTPAGDVAWSFSAGLYWPRCIQRLPGFRNLIADSNNNRVIEIDSLGAIVWGFSTAMPYTGARLPNGNTLISSSHRVIEVTPDSTIVWQYPLVVAVLTETLGIVNPASGCTLYTHIHYPTWASAADPVPGVILVPDNNRAGTTFDVSGLADNFARDGFAVLHFDPDGRGQSTPFPENYGGYIHQDGLHACAQSLAERSYVDSTRLGIYSLGYGVTLASGMIARHPSPALRFLLDWEGPADRYQTCRDSGGWVPVAPDSEDFWLEREAARFIKQLPSCYIRMQTAIDQNPHLADKRHCIQLIDSATNTTHGGAGISPWTRVNDSVMNPANLTYSQSSPPEWIPEIQQVQNLPRVILYLHELAQKDLLIGITAPDALLARTRLTASPNPFRQSVTIRGAGLMRVRIYDRTGRLTRMLSGHDALVWDGRDGQGRLLRPGVYFAQSDPRAGAASIMLVRD